jgi:hypothetical protein
MDVNSISLDSKTPFNEIANRIRNFFNNLVRHYFKSPEDEWHNRLSASLSAFSIQQDNAMRIEAA